MTTLLPTEITSFTMPAEITTLELAIAYKKFYMKKILGLPRTMPAKVKKAYADRLRYAEHLVLFHSRKEG